MSAWVLAVGPLLTHITHHRRPHAADYTTDEEWVRPKEAGAQSVDECDGANA